MKKRMVIIAFALAYAVFLSMGLACLYGVAGTCMTVGPDPSLEYPRFVPFCLVVGGISLAVFAGLLLLNRLTAEDVGYTGKAWVMQFFAVLVLSFPMTMLFGWLLRWLSHIF